MSWRLRFSEFARLALLVSPAFYCTWLALGSSFQFRVPEVPFWSIQDLFNASHGPGCFGLNSDEWLQSSRLGNIQTDFRHGDYFPVAFGLEQTICPRESLFVIEQIRDSSSEETFVRIWRNRIIYWAVYHHQHSPAWKEMRARSGCEEELLERNIGPFDFECPNTKFLVISLAKNGIGANMRLGAVPGLIAGIATDRVVLFVNAAKTGPRFIREPWALASCDRRDFQCFFLPITPCVLTEADLAGAYELQREEMRSVFRHGIVPGGHSDDRVLIMHLAYRPQRIPSNFRSALYNKTLISLGSLGREVLPRQTTVDKALQSILAEDDVSNDSYKYYGFDSPVFQSFLLYSLRPNKQAKKDLHDIVEGTVSTVEDTENLYGLPIRASDKCGVESECMPFQSYVSALLELIPVDKGLASLLVSSETAQVLDDLDAYRSNMADTSQLQFVTNRGDIMQGTGFLPKVRNMSGYSADKAMLSALSSLQLQLHTKLILGNCCSNFHLLIKDLLQAGCGATAESTFQCLQQHNNPRYRLCCAWDKSNCTERRH